MVSLFWDSQGVVVIQYLEAGATVAGSLYAEQIKKIAQQNSKKKQRENRAKTVLVHQDNASAHKSAVAMTAIRDAVFEILHLLYSPEFAPSDSSLFSRMKEYLKGQRFKDDEAVVAAAQVSVLVGDAVPRRCSRPCAAPCHEAHSMAACIACVHYARRRMRFECVQLSSMWFSFLAVASLAALAHCAGNEYLPPNKGYNYEPPKIPFPTPPVRDTPPPYRPAPPPTPARPTYVPPPTQPRPTPPPHTEYHDDHHHHDEHHHHHHEPGMPFDFAYAVNEDGNDYSHNAKSDGDVTIGQYRVALPDGRTQIVKYTADWRNGFNAEVMYEGEARYPDQPSGFGRGPGQQYVPPQQGGGYKY